MKVRDLLKTEDDWCKGDYCKDKHTQEVKDPVHSTVMPGSYPDNCRFCLVGAIIQCYGVRNKRFYDCIDKIQSKLGVFPTFWNDAHVRTFEEVRELVEELDI